METDGPGMETDGPDEGRRSSRAGAREWTRVVPIALLVGVVLAAGAAGVQAFDPECRELPREELSLAEMGHVRRLVDRYKSEPGTPLSLTARQASFLLREEFELPVWVSVDGDETSFEVRIPQGDRCWNISFAGNVTVRDAVATLTPTSMTIGHLAVTRFVAGSSWDVVPLQLRLPRAVELLQHLRSVQVVDDRVEVVVDDPGWLR
jgi:hypothetical protein